MHIAKLVPTYLYGREWAFDDERICGRAACLGIKKRTKPDVATRSNTATATVASLLTREPSSLGCILQGCKRLDQKVVQASCVKLRRLLTRQAQLVRVLRAWRLL